MPQKCVVPGCRGNYDNGPQVSVFGFPKDPEKRAKWLRAIPRGNYEVTKNSKVCEVHFQEDDICRVSEYYDERTGRKVSALLKKPLLKPQAVPTKFPSCPQYLSSKRTNREEPEKRRERLENIQMETAVAESLRSMDDFRHSELPKDITIIRTASCMVFAKIDFENAPSISHSVVVNKDLNVKAYFRNVNITKLGNVQLPSVINNVNELCDVITNVLEVTKQKECKNNYAIHLQIALDVLSILKGCASEGEKAIIQFVTEQLLLLTHSKNNNKYSPEFLILSCLFFSISPHAYSFLRNSGYLTLPHPSTLKRLCMQYNVDPKLEAHDQNFLMYAQQKVKYLEDKEKYITLMLDEIHIKPFFDYKGGSVLGVAFNCEQAANSAHVFMVQSLLSSYKDVIHILPVKTISADDLHKHMFKVIKGLENIGFHVVAVITDNNAINRKAMSFFANPPNLSIVYQHPLDHSRPLFYLIDSVHILKCIRNNWLNQRNIGQCMYIPDFPDTPEMAAGTGKLNSASLSALKKLHEAESDNLVKYAHTITSKALFPNNLERQNVKLVLQIFNLKVVEGLRLAGPLLQIDNFDTTAEYIRIITTWWSIVNDKTLFKGEHKLNVCEEPLTASLDDPKVCFLNKFLTWLEIWEKYQCDTGCFTKETQLSLKHTTYAILEFASYCIKELGFTYVLTGKLLTDSLEDRFGRYRQLSGAQYNISLVQLYETEKKLRIQSILPLSLNSHIHGSVEVINPSVSIDHCLDDPWNSNFMEAEIYASKISVLQQDISSVEDYLCVLGYVAGYCVHSVSKQLGCTYCRKSLTVADRESYTFMIQNLDRGGLKYPCEEVVTSVIYNYIVIKKLLSPELEGEFLQHQNHRGLVQDITLRKLNDAEIFLPVELCESGHHSEMVLKRIVRLSTNTLLKNYCKKQNDSITINQATRTKKRKLQTLTKK